MSIIPQFKLGGDMSLVAHHAIVTAVIMSAESSCSWVPANCPFFIASTANSGASDTFSRMAVGVVIAGLSFRAVTSLDSVVGVVVVMGEVNDLRLFRWHGQVDDV